MNNWHLLLFALVAVVQPIASFTERNLVDGRQQCCDRQTPTHPQDSRYSPHGTYRHGKAIPLSQRLSNQDGIREDRGQDLRERESLFSRYSTERTLLNSGERDTRQGFPFSERSTRVEYRVQRITKDLKRGRYLDGYDTEKTFRNIQATKFEDQGRRIDIKASKDIYQNEKNDIQTARVSLFKDGNRVSRHVNERLSRSLSNLRRQSERIQEIPDSTTQTRENLARITSPSNMHRRRTVRTEMDRRQSSTRLDARHQISNNENHHEELLTEQRSSENARIVNRVRNTGTRLDSRQERRDNDRRRNTEQSKSRHYQSKENLLGKSNHAASREDRRIDHRDLREHENRINNEILHVIRHQINDRKEVRDSFSDSKLRLSSERVQLDRRESKQRDTTFNDRLNNENSQERKTNYLERLAEDRRARIVNRQDTRENRESSVNTRDQPRDIIQTERLTRNIQDGSERLTTPTRTSRVRVFQNTAENHRIRNLDSRGIRDIRESIEKGTLNDREVNVRHSKRHIGQFPQDRRSVSKNLNRINGMSSMSEERARSVERPDMHVTRVFSEHVIRNKDDVRQRDTGYAARLTRSELPNQYRREQQVESRKIAKVNFLGSLNHQTPLIERENMRVTKESSDSQVRGERTASQRNIQYDRRFSNIQADQSRPEQRVVSRNLYRLHTLERLSEDRRNIQNIREIRSERVINPLDARYFERLSRDNQNSMSRREERLPSRVVGKVNSEKLSNDLRLVSFYNRNTHVTSDREIRSGQRDINSQRLSRYIRDEQSSQERRMTDRDSLENLATERRIRSAEQRNSPDIRISYNQEIRNVRDVSRRDTRYNERLSKDSRDAQSPLEQRMTSVRTNSIPNTGMGRLTRTVDSHNVRDTKKSNERESSHIRDVTRRETRYNEMLPKGTEGSQSLQELRMTANLIEYVGLERRTRSADNRNIRATRQSNMRESRNIRDVIRRDTRYNEMLSRDTRGSQTPREQRITGTERRTRSVDTSNIRDTRSSERGSRNNRDVKDTMFNERLSRESQADRSSQERVMMGNRFNSLENRAIERKTFGQTVEHRNNQESTDRESRKNEYTTRSGIRYNENLSRHIQTDQLSRERRITVSGVNLLDRHVTERRTRSVEHRNIRNAGETNYREIHGVRDATQMNAMSGERLSREVREGHVSRERRMMATRVNSLENPKTQQRTRSAEQRNVHADREFFVRARDVFRTEIRDNNEREMYNRFRNIEMTRNQEKFVSINNNEENESAFGSWQLSFYTLQAAYLCGLFLQMLTPKPTDMGKIMNPRWWSISASHLIKVD